MNDFCKGNRAGGDWKSPGGGAEEQDLCVVVPWLHWSPYFCADAMEYQWWPIFLLCPWEEKREARFNWSRKKG